jgi:hypothetical protein
VWGGGGAAKGLSELAHRQTERRRDQPTRLRRTWALKHVAGRTPWTHQRRLPTGGDANGTPRNTAVPSAPGMPTMGPWVVFTTKPALVWPVAVAAMWHTSSGSSRCTGTALRTGTGNMVLPVALLPTAKGNTPVSTLGPKAGQ